MRCQKCKGLVVNEYGDARCLNCGARYHDAPSVAICASKRPCGKDAGPNGYCESCERARLNFANEFVRLHNIGREE